jgi:hypothetical protein
MRVTASCGLAPKCCRALALVDLDADGVEGVVQASDVVARRPLRQRALIRHRGPPRTARGRASPIAVPQRQLWMHFQPARQNRDGDQEIPVLMKRSGANFSPGPPTAPPPVGTDIVEPSAAESVPVLTVSPLTGRGRPMPLKSCQVADGPLGYQY